MPATGRPEVVAVSVAGDDPVRWLTVPLGRGLNVVYGRNGVGKTRLLQALRDTLTLRVSEWSVNEWTRYDPTVALYAQGGWHINAPYSASPGDLAWVVPSARGRPSEEHEIEWQVISPGRRRERLLAEVQSQLPWPNPSAEEASTLLDLGRFFVVPRDGGSVWLAGHPDTARFTSRWLDAGAYEGDPARYPDHWYKGPPPLPETVGYGELPSRCGLPLVRLGSLADFDAGSWEIMSARFEIDDLLELYRRNHWMPPAVISDAEVDNLDELTRAQIADTMREEVSSREGFDLLTGGQANPSPSGVFAQSGEPGTPAVSTVGLQRYVEAIAHRANEWLTLLDDPPVLRLRITPVDEWFTGSVLQWTASDPWSNQDIPITELGWAHGRWARFGILRALRGDRSTNALLVVDEPERGLHISAVRHLATNVSNLGDFVVAATHSKDLLDARGVALHVTRDHRRLMTVVPLEIRPSNELQGWTLGIPRSDLMLLTRVVLCVEGPHDRAVIEALLSRDLAEARAWVVPLGGTAELEQLVDSQFLFDFTDAVIMVVVDNGSSEWVDGWMSKLRGRTEAQQRYLLIGIENEAETEEELKLVRLAQAACNAGKLDRIALHPLEARDISDVLPVAMLTPQFRSVEERDRAYLRFVGRNHFVRGDGRRKKEWMRSLPGAPPLTTEGLAALATTLAREIDAGAAQLPHTVVALGQHLRSSARQAR
jgi:hypothetical protein